MWAYVDLIWLNVMTVSGSVKSKSK